MRRDHVDLEAELDQLDELIDGPFPVLRARGHRVLLYQRENVVLPIAPTEVTHELFRRALSPEQRRDLRIAFCKARSAAFARPDVLEFLSWMRLSEDP